MTTDTRATEIAMFKIHMEYVHKFDVDEYKRIASSSVGLMKYFHYFLNEEKYLKFAKTLIPKVK